MDKYEYQLKTEHIRQVAARKEYGEAAKLCDTIDWTKIRDVKMLTLAADVYTAVGEYEKAIDILQQAYEYAAMGRRIVYRLTELALKADSYDDAKNYFEEFCRIAPNDQGRYILLYKMARYQKATLDEKIKILEAYKREDFDEKWAYELAVLYAMNNEKDKCIQLCDDIILWFGLGKYVEKALSLKSQFAPLTPAQKEKVQKFADKKAQEENEKLQKKQEEQEKKESQAELAKKAAAQEKISKWQAEQEAAKKEAKAREDEQKALLEREEKLRKQREEELEAVERLKKEQRLEHARQSVVTSDMNEIMAVIQRAKQEDVQNELQDELAKQVQQVQQLAGEKNLELVSEIPSDVEEKEKLQVSEDISHMQDEISEDKTTESEVLDYETSENETSDVETANTEISEKTSDSENADEAVWFEAYKPEEEPQISEWAAPVAETVEVEPEEEVQEEPEKEPEEEETQEEVQEELEKEPEEAGPQEEIQEESKKDPEEAETQEEIQEEIQEEPEEEEPQEEFEEEPEEEDAQEESEEEPEVKEPQEESAESRQPDMTANSGLPIVNPEDMSRVWHFAIQAMPDEDDIELALEYLEELAECSSRAVPRSVVKITGQKLNQKGLVKSIDKLLGKTILIEDAADMNERVINEFCKIIDPTDRSLLVVFIDTPASIRHLLIDYPQLAQVVTAQFVRETYSVTELLEYARGYADREDSVFDKSGELALMERLKVIAGNQERNKKRIVEMIVNNAIEKAEKKSMRKLFQSKYDKRGCLILRDKDFEVG